MREGVREGEECEEGWKRDRKREDGWKEERGMGGGCLSPSFVVVVQHRHPSVRPTLLFIVVVLRRCQCDVASR
jgi:hypothetical protein